MFLLKYYIAIKDKAVYGIRRGLDYGSGYVYRYKQTVKQNYELNKKCFYIKIK